VSTEPFGLAVIDKPAGITSHDVVATIRRSLSVRRVGHAGTLDPPATGVLLVGVGRSTRLLRFLQGTDKAYDGTFVLGSTTTTLDATGEVTGTFDMMSVTPDEVAAAAASLTGEIDQIPPMVSALHVDGRRLHELAREGVEVERAARPVTVAAFDVELVGAGTWRFHVECGSGTYVRSLVDDLGRALGGGAHLSSLRRTRVGRFSIDDAVALDAFTAQGRGATLLDPAAMVAHLAQVRVDAADAASLAHGRKIAVARPEEATGPVAVVGPDRDQLAVGEIHGTGTLRPDVVLATPIATTPGE